MSQRFLEKAPNQYLENRYGEIDFLANVGVLKSTKTGSRNSSTLVFSKYSRTEDQLESWTDRQKGGSAEICFGTILIEFDN